MNRRTVLASVPALLSGCLANTSSTDERSPKPPTDSSTSSDRLTDGPTATRSNAPPATSPPPAYSLVRPRPNELSRSAVRSRLASHACAELTAEQGVCLETDQRLSVSLNVPFAELPSGTVEFTVRNDADEPFTWNEYAWKLYKFDGENWRYLAPLAITAPLHLLSPDSSHRYSISADNTTFHGTESYVTTEHVTLSGLGPGVYGFVNESGYFQSSPEETLAVGAVFGFFGTGPGVRPTDAVETIERTDSTLTVRGDPGDDVPRAFELRLVKNADETLLPEHVLQLQPLRNTLSYAATEGVDTIRYITGTQEVDTALSYLDVVTKDGTNTYGFRDYAFETRSVPP